MNACAQWLVAVPVIVAGGMLGQRRSGKTFST
jgi:hypothetical protein